MQEYYQQVCKTTSERKMVTQRTGLKSQLIANKTSNEGNDAKHKKLYAQRTYA